MDKKIVAFAVTALAVVVGIFLYDFVSAMTQKSSATPAG